MLKLRVRFANLALTKLTFFVIFASASAAAPPVFATADRRSNLMQMFKGSSMPLVSYFTPLHLKKGKNERLVPFAQTGSDGTYIASAVIDPADNLEDEEVILARQRCKVSPQSCAPFMRGRRAPFLPMAPFFPTTYAEPEIAYIVAEPGEQIADLPMFRTRRRPRIPSGFGGAFADSEVMLNLPDSAYGSNWVQPYPRQPKRGWRNGRWQSGRQRPVARKRRVGDVFVVNEASESDDAMIMAPGPDMPRATRGGARGSMGPVVLKRLETVDAIDEAAEEEGQEVDGYYM